MPGHTKCCTCHAKSSQQTWRSEAPNATPLSLRKSAPGPPNSSDEHVSCIAPATENASLQILFKCPTPAIVFGNATKPSRFAHFWHGAQSLAPATRNDICTSKSGPEPWCVLYILTSKCASRHNGVHFFDISQLLKVVRTWVCFVHFDFEICFAPQRRALFRHLQLRKVLRDMSVFCTFFTSQMCFAPQRRALFRHLNFQKWSEHGVFCTFWLRNVLRATTFWLRSRRFSEPTFRPSRGANHWKHTVFRDFPTFSRTWIFFLLRLFAHLDLLSSETFSFFFSSLLFSDSSHLCFSSAHIVGSLTSKLPSITMCVCVLRVQEPNWTSPSATCSYFWGYTFQKPSINESRAIPELWNWLTGGCAPRILTFFLMVQKRDLGFQTTCPLVLKSNTNNRPRVIASAALLSFWSLPQQHHGKSIGYD